MRREKSIKYKIYMFSKNYILRNAYHEIMIHFMSELNEILKFLQAN